MSDFKKAMEKKGTLVGNRVANSDEALGINFKDLDNVILADIKIDSLRENPHQPRTSMDQVKLDELKNSNNPFAVVVETYIRLLEVKKDNEKKLSLKL